MSESESECVPHGWTKMFFVSVVAVAGEVEAFQSLGSHVGGDWGIHNRYRIAEEDRPRRWRALTAIVLTAGLFPLSLFGWCYLPAEVAPGLGGCAPAPLEQWHCCTHLE